MLWPYLLFNFILKIFVMWFCELEVTWQNKTDKVWIAKVTLKEYATDWQTEKGPVFHVVYVFMWNLRNIFVFTLTTQ